jgi:hypothetical protein
MCPVTHFTLTTKLVGHFCESGNVGDAMCHATSGRPVLSTALSRCCGSCAYEG